MRGTNGYGWYFVVAAIVLFIPTEYIRRKVEAAKRRRFLAPFLAREALSDDEIFERFYANSGLTRSSVIEVWHEIATTLDMPPERIRPDDQFEDIALRWQDLEALNDMGEVRGKQQGVDIYQTCLETVDECVKFLALREP